MMSHSAPEEYETAIVILSRYMKTLGMNNSLNNAWNTIHYHNYGKLLSLPKKKVIILDYPKLRNSYYWIQLQVCK